MSVQSATFADIHLSEEDIKSRYIPPPPKIPSIPRFAATSVPPWSPSPSPSTTSGTARSTWSIKQKRKGKKDRYKNTQLGTHGHLLEQQQHLVITNVYRSIHIYK